MSAPDPRRWWALAALLLGVLTIGFDATILNVALPTLATELHATTGELQWLVDAYVLVFAGLLLPMGVLGDRLGRKRVMLAGLALFGGASVLACFADTIGPLIAARAVMGAGAAILTPVSFAMLPVLFPPTERTKAIAYAAIGMGVGVPLGPIVGGLLLRHYWWGSIFLVNVPVVVLSMIAIGLLVRESRDPAPARLDLVGAVLSTVGLTAFVYGVIEAPGRGWGSAPVLVALLGGAALLAAFIAWERRTDHPMIDLSLFGRSRFLWGSIAATIASFALFGLLFVLPQYLQVVRGYDAFEVGVRLLPMMGGLIVGARVSEMLGARFGAKWPIALGLALTAKGLAFGAFTTANASYGYVAGWLVLVGAGTGLCMAPAMDLVIGELPAERSGSGTALTMTMRQVGAALGVALLGSLSAWAYTGRLHLDGLPATAAEAARDSVAGAAAAAAQLGDPALLLDAQSAYLHAMSVALLTCAAVAVVGAVLVTAFVPGRRRVPAGPAGVVEPAAVPAA